MNRLEALLALKKETYYEALFSKLKKGQFTGMLDFLKNNDDLESVEFEAKVSTWFLDKPKPAQWTVMMELVSAANKRSKK